MLCRTLTSTGEEISYEWTEFDRLKRVKSDTNGRMQNARYGVDGLRTKKQDADGNSSREYGAGISTSASTPLTQNSTAPSISYISGHMILGAEIDGEFVYHLGDALSTVRDVVDDEGDVIRSFEFDEYGNLLNSSGTGATSPKTWIGGLSVNDDRADSGLWNMGHRNYAGGVLGRFISRDPIGHRGNLNLYNYTTNPVNFVDPSGLDTVITYTSGRISRYGSNQWEQALNALRKAKVGEIDIIDFYGHGNPNVCYAGEWDYAYYLRHGEDIDGAGGVRLKKDGDLVMFLQKGGENIEYPMEDVLGGKNIRKIRYHSCNAAGGTPDYKERRRRDPKHAGNHLPPTDVNLANLTRILLGDIVVQGSQGVYIFRPNPGNPMYEEPKTYRP